MKIRIGLQIGMCQVLVLTPMTAQTPDTAAMSRAVSLMDQVCAADRAQTWGKTLCGPLLLGNWGSKEVLASVQDSAGRFTPLGRWWVGKLGPRQFPSNTAVLVGGTHFSMVVLPLPEEDAIAATLLTHEQFHRIQGEIGLRPRAPDAGYLDEEEARRWLRLEWRALALAIGTLGTTSCGHAQNAIAFRQARQSVFPAAAAAEPSLERHEGMAEYTGTRLAGLVYPGIDARLIKYLGEAESLKSYVRSFAYSTGGAYGRLLDRNDPEWRSALADGSGPHQLLAERIGCDAPNQSADLLALSYGDSAIRAEERLRADSLTAIRADFMNRLVEGPVFRSPGGHLNFTFDPNTVTPLGTHGNVYGGGTYSGAWGSLEVEAGGVLVGSTFEQVRVALPSDGVSAWRLTIAEGWRLVVEGSDLTMVGPDG